MLNTATSPLENAIGELAFGALFFAMRSCEYSRTSEPNTRTIILRLKNITFYNAQGKRIHRNFEFARLVKITFPNQKNNEKGEVITRSCSLDQNNNPVLCWSRIVNRIRSDPQSTEETQVNTVYINDTVAHISATQIRSYIKRTVGTFDQKFLGFSAADVGTHSIRTSFATFLFLQGLPIQYIMLEGRWKSDAVLRYIRKNAIFTDITHHILHNNDIHLRILN